MSDSGQKNSHKGRTPPQKIPRRKKINACIINDMPPVERTEKMTLRLTQDEAHLRDALAKRLGVNSSGVMRMALLRLAEAEKIALETQK
jgi:hypothetical protein